ncbi:MAG: helix-turn-helix transcriptional regulator [Solirubrobacterales bacterium]|nr:helix-turn-helix transcriptional regulator [Solirubrobacterales bacterium]
MVGVLRELADGALRAAELEQALSGTGHTTIIRRLHHLLERDLVGHEREPGLPPHACKAGVAPRALYGLTEAGRALLQVTAAATRWQATWCPSAEQPRVASSLAIRLLADDHVRDILLGLADEPRSGRELDRCVRGVGRSALRRRLHELVQAGLVERDGRLSVPKYELTTAARRLALIAVLAVRWERRWAPPEKSTRVTDLADLLRMLAPIAVVPEPLAGVCHLRVETAEPADHDIYLEAGEARLLLLEGLPSAPPRVIGQATAEGLCDALLRGSGQFEVRGDRALLMTVIGALRAALVA